MGGGGGGAGGGLVTDANARLLVEDDVAGAPETAVTDVRDLDLFDFGVDIDPPSVAVGEPVGVSWGQRHAMTWGRQPYLHAGILGSAAYLGPGPVDPPVLSGPHAFPWQSRTVVSQTDGNVPWPVTPSGWGCGLGPGSWGGWHEAEYWRPLVMPAKPDDVAGLHFDVGLANPRGAATGGVVRVTANAPVAGREGTPVGGILAPGTHAVFIPASLIPAEGGTLWVGVGPAWEADHDFSEAHPGGGVAGGCAVSFHPPFATGENGSGALDVVGWGAASWAVYVTDGDSFGTLVVHDEEDDPWEGGNAVLDLGGSGVSGVSGGAFYVAGPGDRCIGAVGDAEDEDEPRGPWADPWAAGFALEVDALGAATGEVSLATIRPGGTTVGRVLLGPTPGVSVQAAGLEALVAAVAVTTGERWAVRFDDRSEDWLRAKLWRAADGEPATWTVELPLPDGDDDDEETGDSGDRIVLCIVADTGQTIRVHPPTARAFAPAAWIRERLGWASGDEDRFVTSHPFAPGSLELGVAGVSVPPSRQDGETCQAWLDYLPTRGMVVWARYQSE